MVDVSTKSATARRATASCVVRTSADLDALAPSSDGLDLVLSAKLAGITAAKRTSDLIPLCHPLQLGTIEVEVTWTPGALEVSSTVAAVDRTGVEMEALTACATAAVCLLAGLRDVDPNARVDDLSVLTKSGGKSGPWGRQVEAPPS